MNIKKYFDDFTFNARVKPVLTIILPFIIMVIYKGIVDYELKESGLLLLVVVIVLTFGAYAIREFGKAYEEKMFKELGAKPTTIILRYSNDIIDTVSKTRYHKYINSNYNDMHLPLTIEEERENPQSDQEYSSAINILRTAANSQRDKFPRVYQELKKYNYWRNMYGCKWYAMGLYSFAALIQIIIMVKNKILFELEFSSPESVILVGMICWCVIFCGLLTKRTVTRNAFDYAKTLIETIEDLEKK